LDAPVFPEFAPVLLLMNRISFEIFHQGCFAQLFQSIVACPKIFFSNEHIQFHYEHLIIKKTFQFQYIFTHKKEESGSQSLCDTFITF